MASKARERTQAARKKTTKPGERVQDEEVLRFKVKGRVYDFDPNQVTGSTASELRRATGFSVQETFTAFNNGATADIDTIAAIVFMSRRQSGERCSFADVADDLSYKDLASISYDEDYEDDAPDSPEV